MPTPYAERGFTGTLSARGRQAYTMRRIMRRPRCHRWQLMAYGEWPSRRLWRSAVTRRAAYASVPDSGDIASDWPSFFHQRLIACYQEEWSIAAMAWLDRDAIVSMTTSAHRAEPCDLLTMFYRGVSTPNSRVADGSWRCVMMMTAIRRAHYMTSFVDDQPLPGWRGFATIAGRQPHEECGLVFKLNTHSRQSA